MLKRRMCTIVAFLVGASTVGSGQWDSSTVENERSEVPVFFQRQFQKRIPPLHSVDRSIRPRSVSDWRRAVDSAWGQGLPTSEKLGIFDKYWKVIDSAFACFHNLPVNWDSLRTIYRAEIENGVSRGRFQGIIDHLSISLREAHTAASDVPVVSTDLERGVPLHVVGGWGQNGHFGAALTPLPDSSLLVYNAWPYHPLGIRRGDIVLGYNGIAWKDLSRMLLEAQLPLTGWWWGCSPSAYTHSLLMSAGLNWHLFDTIDVVQFSTGDTLHLPTAPLEGQALWLFATEQMDIPGVAKPNYYAQHLFSSGIIDGTNIGYVYGWGWFWNAEAEFLSAVESMMQTDGLIIDFRMNYGGNMFLSDSGLSRLFPLPVPTIDWAIRCDPSVHTQMCPVFISEYYKIPGTPPGYMKPIAVLVGPGAVSSGDQVALRLKYHPFARFFGKSTTAAFNSPRGVDLGNADWSFRFAEADAYRTDTPGEYLTHRELPVDEEVWLSPSSVAQGRDDVVEAAVEWINRVLTAVQNEDNALPNRFALHQNYPNPFNPTTTIRFRIAQSGFVSLKVFDLLGREVATLVKEELQPGTYQRTFDGSGLASGIYFYRMRAGRFVQTNKLVLQR